MKNGFFEGVSGDRSSSRLSGFIIILMALIFAQEIIWFGRDQIMIAATAAGTEFLTVAGSAMLFMFQNKQTEIKHEEVVNSSTQSEIFTK